MLNASKELALNLNTRSDELNESVTNLEKISTQQVEFLTNIAGAVEQIASSMTHMNQKGESVLKQSKDITKIEEIVDQIF